MAVVDLKSFDQILPLIILFLHCISLLVPIKITQEKKRLRKITLMNIQHYVKSVHIRSFSCPYFPAFGLNMVRYEVSFRIQSECRKIQTRKNSVFGHFSRGASSGFCKSVLCFVLVNFKGFQLSFVHKNTDDSYTNTCYTANTTA